jgi:K+-sensing histidine kinase KdpD
MRVGAVLHWPRALPAARRERTPRPVSDNTQRAPVPDRRRTLAAYGGALLGVGAVTAALAPFSHRVSPTAVALALLLVVLFVATARGMRPAMAASVAGVLAFNFFFLPPFGTLHIENPQNWVALAAFLVTAVTAGQLSARAKRRAEEAELARAESEGLRSSTP